MAEQAFRRGITLAAAMLLLGTAGRADDFGPWSADFRSPSFANATEDRPVHRSLGGGGSNPFTLAFRVWSQLLTRIDGPRCAHQPTCSVYAHQAVGRYGIPRGVWMALNRLMRGAHSSALRTLPMVRTPHGIRYLDPLD